MSNQQIDYSTLRLSFDEAHTIVQDGRAYTREHFPAGNRGSFVGHVDADLYDRAVDVLVSESGKLVIKAFADATALDWFTKEIIDAIGFCFRQNGDDEMADEKLSRLLARAEAYQSGRGREVADDH